MEIRNSSNYGQSVGVKPQTHAGADFVLGAATAALTTLLTSAGNKNSISEQNRQIGQSLAKVGHSKAQAA